MIVCVPHTALGTWGIFLGGRLRTGVLYPVINSTGEAPIQAAKPANCLAPVV